MISGVSVTAAEVVPLCTRSVKNGFVAFGTLNSSILIVASVRRVGNVLAAVLVASVVVPNNMGTVVVAILSSPMVRGVVVLCTSAFTTLPPKIIKVKIDAKNSKYIFFIRICKMITALL